MFRQMFVRNTSATLKSRKYELTPSNLNENMLDKFKRIKYYFKFSKGQAKNFREQVPFFNFLQTTFELPFPDKKGFQLYLLILSAY